MALPNGAGGYQLGDGNLTEINMSTQVAPTAKAAAATTLGKAAIGAGASAAIGAGAKAAAKPGQKRKAAKLEAQNKAKEASAKSTDMGELGTKSKITDNE